MKRLISFSLFFLLLMVPLITNAQVNLETYFVLEQNNIIYEEFTDGTPTVTGDDQATNVMMPFYFPYGGEEYNYVRICTNGWVGLGNDITHTAYANDIGSTAYYRLLAPCWDDLQVNAGTGTMTYRTEGAAPNRVFAIQYKNVNRLGATSDLLNFQVRLYEGSGEISFTYGDMSTTYTGWTASIGVSGLEGGTNDFISITPGLSSTYSSTTANNSINASGISTLSNKKYSILPEGDYVFLTYPTNGSVNEISLTLTWEVFPEVVSYHVQVATTADFADPVIDDEGIIGEEYDLTDLDELTRYFWRVRALTFDDLSNWSQVWNFLTTGELPPPILIAPTNGLANADPVIRLRWESSMFATHYSVQAAADPDFYEIVKEETDINTNSYVLTGLSMNSEYYWRVRMHNLYDESDWSDEWMFTTGNYAVVGIGENYDTDYYNYVSPSPYSNWYSHARLYFLYTAEELLEGGAIPNTYITEFGWNVAVNQSNVGTLNPGEFAIRMKLTNWTQLTNQWTYEDWQTVWEPQSPWLAQLGWNMHECIDPLYWDGESSILVETCFSHWDRIGNPNPQQYWTTTPVARVQQRSVYESSGPELDYCTIEENIGWGGPMMNRANIKFGLEEAVFLVPVLVEPQNGAYAVDVNPLFMWQPVDGAETYRIQISTSYNFESIVIDEEGLYETEFQVPDGFDLEELTTYYWRVNASDDENTSFWSQRWNFITVGELPVPVLLSPENGATGIPASAILTWEEYFAATGYTIEVALDEYFEEIVFSETVEGATTVIATGLSLNTEYFWRAKMSNVASESDWCEPWAFATGSDVIVGVGTSYDTDYYNYVSPSPYSNWYHHARIYFLYTAEELLNAGATPNTYITNFGWDVAMNQSNVGALNPGEFAIKMKLTPMTQLNGTWNYEDWQTVWEPRSPWIAQLGWNMHECIDPLFWDGQSSLLVETCMSHWDRTGNPNPQQYWTYTPQVMCHYRSVYEPDGPELDYCSFPETYNGTLRNNRANIKLTFEESVLTTPILVSPDDGQLSVPVNPLFMWNAVDGAESYSFQLGTDKFFENLVMYEEGLYETEFQVPDGYELEEMTGYYWRVNATDGENISFWSFKRYFITEGELPPPVLVSPSNGTDELPPSVLLTWEPYFAATGYNLQVSSTPTFESTVISTSVTESSYLTTGLAMSAQYYWRVQMYNEEAESEWCEPWTFITGNYFTIGQATTSSNGYPVPYGNLYYGAKHQLLIRVDEILDAGGLPGVLTSLSFNVAVVGNTNPLQNFTIKMKPTNLNVLDGVWDTQGFETVYTHPGYVCQLGWNKHTFDEPYFWDGESNLLIDVCFQNTNYQGNQTMYYTNSGYNSVRYFYADVSNVCTSPTSCYLSGNRSNMMFEIDAGALMPPQNIAPANNSFYVSDTPLFDWTDVEEASSYGLLVATDVNFLNVVIEATDLFESEYQVPAGSELSPLTRYYWKANASNDESTGAYSQVWNFVTEGDLYAPTLIAPSNNASGIPSTVEFDWNDVLTAESYQIQVSVNNEFTELAIDQEVTESELSAGLGMSTTYYWRVRAINESSISPWSSVWQFTTGSYIVIGSGTNYNTNTGYPAPYGNWYYGAKHQILILADEIYDAGGIPGTLTSLAFNIYELATGRNYVNFRIRMKPTMQNALNNVWDEDDFTDVFFAPNLATNTTGWFTHTFEDPFPWDGSSNILVDVCFNNSSIGYNHSTYYTITPFNSVRYYRADNATVCTAYSTATLSTYRPNIMFSVDASGLFPPSNLYPNNGEFEISLNPLINWSDVEEATSYGIIVATDPNFDNIVIAEEGLEESEFQVPDNYLTPLTMYYWRANASDDERTSPWSQRWNFATEGDLPAPMLIAPENYVQDIPSTVHFDWEDVFGAFNYQIQVALDEDFAEVVIDETLTTSYFAYGLAMREDYYWRVRASSPGSTSDWSSVWQFTTGSFFEVGQATTSSTSYPNPYGNTWWGVKNQMLILADEVYDAGGTPGAFTSLSFNVAILNNTNPLLNFTIKMKPTSQTVLDATWDMQDFQTVYVSSSFVNTAGWNRHEFTDPFVWDGTSNILIDVCFQNSSWQGSQTIFYTNAGFQASRYYYGDNAVVCTDPEYCYNSNNRPNMMFGIDPSNLLPPMNFFPTSGTYDIELNPIIDWSDVEGATSYGLIVATDPDFNFTVIDEEGLDESYYEVPEGTFEPLTLYYWKANASDDEDISPWSQRWWFGTTGDLPAPTLLSPSNFASGIPATVPFEWEDIFGAFNYNIQIASDQNFNNIVVDDLLDDVTSYNFELSLNSSYFWRVRASSPSSTSDWSEVWRFSTGNFFVIGTGTAFNGEYEYPAPYGNYWWGAKHQILVRASEMTQAGGQAGDLTSISFNVNVLNNIANLNGFTIRLKQTTATTLDANWDTQGFTTVFTNNSLPISLGWNTHMFSTAFPWDGSSNVLVDICFNNSSYTRNAGMFYTATSYNSVRYFYSDATTVCTDPGTPYLTGNRPNIMFSGGPTEPLPPAPVLVSPANTAQNQSVAPLLTWESVEEAATYRVQVSRNTNFTTTVLNVVTEDTEYQITNPLLYLTQYYWRVRSITESGTDGNWSSAWSFRTAEEITIPESWEFVETDNFAQIVVPVTIEPMIGDREFVNGDAIGLFYERNPGEWYCAGYDVWSENGAAITVYGDDASTLEKDGYDLDEAFVFRVWDKVDQRELPATATFLMGPEAYEAGGFSMLSGLNVIIPVTHNIPLSTGWNLVSSYADIFGTRNIAEIFSDIDESVNIVKDGYGNMYIPSQSINTIGNWHYVYGYSVNVSQSAVLSITAPKLRPESIGFGFAETGWHLIGYLRDNPMSAPIALASVNEDMLMAKNNVGGIYSPVYGINTLGNLVPGEGYWVYLTTENANISYPANNAGRALAGDDITPTAKHLIPELSVTGNSATLLLSINASDGNEIGVYNAKDELIGSGMVYNGVAAVTIWGDNSISSEVDGAMDNELLNVKLYDVSSNNLNTITMLNIQEVVSGLEQEALYYSTNAIYLAKASVQTDAALNMSIVNVPNPVSSITRFDFSLTSDEQAEIFIYNIRGEEVARLANGFYKAGTYSFSFDASDLTSGAYNVVLRSGNQTASTIMMINK